MLFSAVCNQLSSRNNLDRSKVIQSESGTIWSWRYIAHIYMLTHYLISSCEVPLYIDYNLIIGFNYLLCSCNNGSFKVLAPPSIYMVGSVCSFCMKLMYKCIHFVLFLSLTRTPMSLVKYTVVQNEHDEPVPYIFWQGGYYNWPLTHSLIPLYICPNMHL